MSNVVELIPRSQRVYGPSAKIGVVVQARMTSERFPGKVLALLDNKPIIQHVVERCKAIRAPKKVISPIQVIVAVPDAPESEPLLKLVTDELGIANFCGPEYNVLERYVGAAKFFNLDIIMRITADCPLIDPNVCSEVLQLLMWRKVNYASNCHEERTFPKGLDCEVFTRECLEATYITVMDNYKEAKRIEASPTLEVYKNQLKQAKYDMEHVTPLMQRHPEIKRALVKSLAGNNSSKNWCVDHPSDIDKLEKLIAEVRAGNAKLALVRPKKEFPKLVPIDNPVIIQAKVSV